MTRRQFLHGVAAAGAATMLPARIFSLPAAPGMEIVRTATDRVELRLPSGQRRFRILQLTDTHFGTNSDANRAKDAASRALIRQMHHAHQPDLLFHTGDFVNNDKENPVHAAYDFMNDLGTPWALVYGNHDHPNGKPGQLSLDELAKRQENSISGWASRGGNERDYCWRAELMQDGETRASLFAFNTGDPQTGMIINPSQTAWFLRQMEEDRRAGLDHPIFVMQHIPTVEFKTVYDQNRAVGRRGEDVCYELDKGEIFGHFQTSGRVRAIFVGHDHVNDYVGDYEGIKLIYGKCSGYSGYGDWQRGGRLIDIDCSTARGRTRVVLGPNMQEAPEWRVTMQEADAG
ncbi:MAG: metallophosphoesterase [Armatimonadota bacterium]|jgi:hypothetical protein